MELCGTPGPTMLDKIEPNARNYLTQMKIIPREFKHAFRNCSNQAIDVLQGMLKIDPDCRLTAEGALAHPYFEEYHDQEDEPTGKKNFVRIPVRPLYLLKLFKNSPTLHGHLGKSRPRSCSVTPADLG